jgi:hypothetical protein
MLTLSSVFPQASTIGLSGRICTMYATRAGLNGRICTVYANKAAFVHPFALRWAQRHLCISRHMGSTQRLMHHLHIEQLLLEC